MNVFSNNHEIILSFDIKFNDLNVDYININDDYKNKNFYLNKSNIFFNCASNNIISLNLYKTF